MCISVKVFFGQVVEARSIFWNIISLFHLLIEVVSVDHIFACFVEVKGPSTKFDSFKRVTMEKIGEIGFFYAKEIPIISFIRMV